MQKERQIQSCKNHGVLPVLKDQVTMGLWNIEVSGVGQNLFKVLGTVDLNISGYNPPEFQTDA